MGYPLHQVMTDYKTYFSKDLRLVGDQPRYQDCFVEGSVEDMDFIAYYSNFNGSVSMAVGSPSQQNKMCVINEAMRLSMMPQLEQIRQTNGLDFKMLDKSIRQSKRSGCFRSLIFGHRFNPWMSMIIWRDRDRMSNTYYNINKDGRVWDENELNNDLSPGL